MPILNRVFIDLHVGFAFILFFLSLGLSVAALRTRKQPSLNPAFWRWQSVTQIGVLLLAVSGASLYLVHLRPRDSLRFLYGVLALLTIGVQRGFMPGRSLRAVMESDYGKFHEVWVYFGLNLFLFFMLGRGITTGLFGF